MRVQNISITRLFGMFDHRIPLFTKDPITIIHGPNGVGKTSVLRLIYGTLKPDYSHLRQVPFQEIEICFEDGTSLCASLSEGEATPPSTRTGRADRRTPQQEIHFTLKRDGIPEEDFSYVHQSHDPRLLPRLERFLPFLDRVGAREWHDERTNHVLGFEDIIHLYGPELPQEFRTLGEPDWLQEIQRRTPIHFIETQRLLDVRPSRRSHAREDYRESAVKVCSDDFANRIKSKLAESATLSQSLERTFPARLISQEGPAPLSESQIRDELAKIDERRGRLVNGGLLDRGLEPPLPAKEFDETTKRVLAVYIQDAEKKLGVFDDFLKRIELMKSIINSRFLYKVLDVNREEGFVVTTREGRQISLSDLSSGEQHELVLLYELLFKARKNTLILIDEPELSLHIAWQQQFLRDLVEITRLAELQVLIATHSPQIIHDRWDLTVELSGPTL